MKIHYITSITSYVTGPAYQDLWQLFLQVWGPAPADGDLFLRGLGPGRRV